MAGSRQWWEAAEIIGVSDRTMRRWRERYQEGGYNGPYDRRKRGIGCQRRFAPGHARYVLGRTERRAASDGSKRLWARLGGSRERGEALDGAPAPSAARLHEPPIPPQRRVIQGVL
jgi:transposase-like protein